MFLFALSQNVTFTFIPEKRDPLKGVGKGPPSQMGCRGFPLTFTLQTAVLKGTLEDHWVSINPLLTPLCDSSTLSLFRLRSIISVTL